MTVFHGTVATLDTEIARSGLRAPTGPSVFVTTDKERAAGYAVDRPAGYPYALGHVHVHADFADAEHLDPTAKELSRLHLPTARVALELVLWHLIAEWGVTPKTDDWRDLLSESLKGFEQRRRAP